MAGNLIVTTPKISMHALAYKGIVVYDYFSQIRDMLLRRFGDEFVLLFARPVENQGDGQIDWYTPVQGRARRLDELDDAERQKAYSQISHAAREILRFAEELIAKGTPQDVTRGNILKLALRYPDDNALYIVGQQPVFTCWGFGPGSPGVEGKYLSRIGAQEEKKVVPASSVPPPVTASTVNEPNQVKVAPAPVPFGWRWLWWLFPLLSALLLFFLLFCQFGNLAPLSGIALFEWKNFFLPADDGRKEKLISLQNELFALGKKVDDHVAMCKPSDLPDRQKKLPGAMAEPEKGGESLVIPDNAENMDFLEGEWLCRTGLGNAETGEPVQFSFTFNKDGIGSGVVHEKDEQCAGSAKGSIEEGLLRISLGVQKCNRSNRTYQPVEIECRNAFANGGTVCRGINRDGTGWRANFQRLR